MADTAQTEVVKPLSMTAPLRWLRQGATDLRARPWPSVFYGACFALMGWILALLLRGSPGMMLAMTAGFLLVGPFMAMGLYEVARCHAAGARCDLFATTLAWRRNVGNLAIMGVALGIVMALWARSSMLVIAVSFTWQVPSVPELISGILRGEHLEFALAWLGVGAIFASLVFAFTAVSIPMMLDRNTDAISAMLRSVAITAQHLPVMLVWACLIVLLIGLGFASAFIGLIITGPWVGLATWHAYRELTNESADVTSQSDSDA
jgi:uncharacterized membrane protein